MRNLPHPPTDRKTNRKPKYRGKPKMPPGYIELLSHLLRKVPR